MSTGNFLKRNARNYYVVDNREYYDPATEEWLDEWREGCETRHRDTEDVELDLTEQGKAEGYHATEVRNMPYGEHEWRGCFTLEKDFWLKVAGNDLRLTGRVFLRPGYYEAANLDWDIFTTELGEIGEIGGRYGTTTAEYAGEVAEDMLLYSDWSEGVKVMNRDKVTERIRRALEDIADELDDFCRRVCTGVYGICGRFSNGETFYCQLSRETVA